MNNIENKIVQMKFDNEQFESAIATTMSTLDKFKEKLKFDKAGKGLEDLGKASGNYNYTLNDIGRSLDQLNGRFSTMGVIGRRVLENLTDSAINFAKNGLGNLLGSITHGGLSRAMNLEQAKFQMQGIFKDADKVHAIIYDDILPELQGTPYSLDQAAVVIGQLGASGIQASEDVRQATRAIAGLAAMSGHGFDEVGRIFSKVAGQGNMMGGELQQLSTYGINAAANIADYFKQVESGEAEASKKVQKHIAKIKDAYGDLSEGTIRDAASKRMIFYEDMASAMDTLYGAHAKKSTEMYTGALEDLKAALARIGAEPAAVGLEVLRNAFNALVPAVDAVNAVLKPFTNATKDVVTNSSGEKAFGGEMYGSLAKEVQRLGIEFANLFVLMDKNGRVMRWTAEGVENYKSKIEAAGDAAAEWKKEYANYIAEGDGIMNPQMWRILTASTKSFTNILKAMSSVIGSIGKGIISAFPKVTLESLANLAEGVERFTRGLILSKENAERLRWVTQGLFTPLGVAVKVAFAAIKGLVKVFQEVYKVMKPSLNAVMAFLGGIGRSVSGFGVMTNQVTDFVFELGKLGISAVVAAAKFIHLDKILGLVQKGIELLAKGFDLAGKYVGSFLSNFIGNASGVTKTVAEFLHLNDVITIIQKGLQKFGSGLAKIFHFEELSKAFDKILDPIKNFLSEKGFVSKIGENISNFVSWVKKLEPLNKIVSGISTAFDTLVSSVSKLTAGPASKVKDWFFKIGGHIADFFNNLKEGDAFTQVAKSLIPAFAKFKNALTSLNVIIKPLLESVAQLIPKLFGFKTMGDMLEAAGNKIKMAAKAIKDFFHMLGKAGKDKSGEALEKVGNSLSKAFNSKTADSIKNFGDAMRSLREGIGDKLANFGGILTKAFGGLDPSTGTRAVKTLAIFMIAFSYLMQMRRLAGALKAWGRVGINLGQWIENFTGGFGLKQVNGAIAKAIRLISLAATLLIFASALKMLTDMNWQQILVGSAVLLAALGAFYAILRALDKLDKNASDPAKVTKLALSIAAIAGGLWLIAQAIDTLSKVDPESMIIGAFVISAIMGAFYLLAKGLNGLDGKAAALGKASFAIIGIAKGLEGMAKAIEALGAIDINTYQQGLEAVVVIMGMFALFARNVQANAKVFSASVGMIAVAGAIMIIYKAISMMAELVKDENFGMALNVITGIFVALAAFAMIAGRSEASILAAGGGMLALANAILIIVAALKIMTTAMDEAAFAKAIASLIVIFGGFAAFAHFAGADTAKAGASMLALALGIVVLVSAIKLMSEIDGVTLATGLLKMAASMLVLSFAMTFLAAAGDRMKKDGVINIVLMSGALLMLAAALGIISAIPFGVIIIGIISLVAALVAVGAVLLAFSSVSVGLVAVAAAFALLGLACVMVGAGIMLFVMALTSLLPLILALSAVNMDALNAGLEVLKVMASGVAEALKIAAVGVLAFGAACLVAGLGLIVFGAGIAVIAVSTLAASLAILALAGSLAVLAVVIQSFFGGGLLETIGSGFDAIGSKFSSGISKLFGSFTGLGDKGKEEMSNAFDAMGQGAEEGAEKNQPIVESAVDDGLMSFMKDQGYSDDMYNFSGLIMDSGTQGITDGTPDLQKALEESVGITPNIFNPGKKAMSKGGKGYGTAFGSGVSSGKGSANKGGQALASAAVSGSQGKKGAMSKEGQNQGKGYGKGIGKAKGEARRSAGQLSDSAVSELRREQKSWGTIGGNAGEGYAQGIRSKISAVANAAASLVKRAISAAKAAQKSKSPSKEFAKLGVWGGEGYANGFTSTTKLVTKATKDVVDEGMKSVASAMADISDIFGKDIDFNPKISPVVDLTKVDEGAAYINRAFTSAVGEVGDTMFSNVSAAASSFNAQMSENAKLASNLHKLTNTLDSMTETMNSRSLNNYITIDGASDPDAFADDLIRNFRLNARTM